MARRKGQDDLTRRRRLNDGTCPTHGVHLLVRDHWEREGSRFIMVECPRCDCKFRQTVGQGTKVWDAVME